MSLSTANRSESCLHAWANRGLFEAPIESRCDALCLLLGRRTTQLQSVCRILYVHVCPTDALCWQILSWLLLSCCVLERTLSSFVSTDLAVRK